MSGRLFFRKMRRGIVFLHIKRGRKREEKEEGGRSKFFLIFFSIFVSNASFILHIIIDGIGKPGMQVAKPCPECKWLSLAYIFKLR